MSFFNFQAVTSDSIEEMLRGSSNNKGKERASTEPPKVQPNPGARMVKTNIKSNRTTPVSKKGRGFTTPSSSSSTTTTTAPTKNRNTNTNNNNNNNNPNRPNLKSKLRRIGQSNIQKRTIVQNTRATNNATPKTGIKTPALRKASQNLIRRARSRVATNQNNRVSPVKTTDRPGLSIKRTTRPTAIIRSPLKTQAAKKTLIPPSARARNAPKTTETPNLKIVVNLSKPKAGKFGGRGNRNNNNGSNGQAPSNQRTGIKQASRQSRAATPSSSEWAPNLFSSNTQTQNVQNARNFTQSNNRKRESAINARRGITPSHPPPQTAPKATTNTSISPASNSSPLTLSERFRQTSTPGNASGSGGSRGRPQNQNSGGNNNNNNNSNNNSRSNRQNNPPKTPAWGEVGSNIWGDVPIQTKADNRSGKGWN
eukprot:TRINITY_DN3156_c0_g1_i1.p1 TRINITY_DN3156_c0_g1~~TRINITY_DN3156_c0_g1_i1.p1  ORF type:complete len:424 (+),score=124.42 TRINITY_DN3156_c0_g1_i1:915-2186(+)